MRAINHVGVSVPDIEAAVRWYTKVMGFHLLGGKIKHIKRSENADNGIFRIYPSSLREVKLAFMATGNGVGFEIFEFVEPAYQQQQDFNYNLGGFFHLCVTDADPDALVAKVVSEGGSAVGEAITNARSQSRCVYCKDPWGNVLEVMNMSFDRMGTLDSGEDMKGGILSKY